MKVMIYSTAAIAKPFIHAALEGKAKMEITSVFALEIEDAKKFASDTNIPHYSDNVEDLYQYCDTVYVCTPNGLHYAHAKAMLLARKNVIIEKPMAMSVDEIKELYALAREQGVYLFDAMLIMYNPLLDEIKKIVSTLNVQMIDFNYIKQTRLMDQYLNGEHFNVFDKKMGGGSINDLGIYCAYAFVYLFGDNYKLNSYQITNALDADEAAVVVGIVDNSVFSIRTGKLIADNRPSLISAQEGSIEIDSIGQISSFKYIPRNGEIQEVKITENYRNMMSFELIHFADVVNGDVKYRQEMEQISIAARRLLDEIESHKEVQNV